MLTTVKDTNTFREQKLQRQHSGKFSGWKTFVLHFVLTLQYKVSSVLHGYVLPSTYFQALSSLSFSQLFLITRHAHNVGNSPLLTQQPSFSKHSTDMTLPIPFNSKTASTYVHSKAVCFALFLFLTW